MSQFKRGLPVILAGAMALVLSAPAPAQVLYGSVVGVVEDASRAVMPNAAVLLTHKATGQTYEGKTDEAGRFSIPNVLPGDYDIKVTAQGFKPQTKTDIRVAANTVARADFGMEIGAITEQVTVSAGAALLQTDKADTHTEIQAGQVSNLPLPGYRNYQSLINLVPGATPAAFQNSVTDTPGRSLTTQINGANRNNNMTRIDGAASVNLWLPHHAGYVMPAEMVDTVNITTSAGDAEQGFAGGAAIAVLTKSGTNDLHGSAFWYHDNQHLKAYNFFAKTPNAIKPLRIYNNYGGTIGGPIKKNSLFFFYSFDGSNQRNGALDRYSVPTSDIRTGDFSAYSTPIYDPATGNPDGSGRTQFPGNRIPTNRITSQAQKIQVNFPLPNLAGAANNLLASAVPKFDRYYNDIKMNWNATSKFHLFGHYGIMKATVVGYPIFGEGVGPAPGADPGTGDTKVQNTSAGWNYTFTPTLVYDGVVGYQRQDQTVKGVDFGKDYSTILGIPGIGGPDPQEQGFPNIIFGTASTGSGAYYNGFGVPNWMPLERVEENYTTSQNLTWNKGAHTFRFGFDGVNYRMNHWQPELGAGPRGQFAFAGGPTTLGPSGTPNNYNAYAAFLLGESNQVQKSIQYILMTPREYQFAWYAQDRWQVNRRLTLSLGLRYEYYPLMTRAAQKGIERLDPETNLVYLGGRGEVPKNVGVTVSKKLFAPRVGIAYRLDDQTVIRTGYGVNYDPLPFSRPLRGFYPLTVNFAFEAPNGFATARTFEQGIPPVTGPDLSTGVVTLPPVADMRSPYLGELHRGYTQSWNFTVERKLPEDILATVGYVGTQTVHQLADRDINSGFPGSGQAGRPYAIKFNRRVATNMWDGYLSSNYHSLQTSVRKQLSRGLMVQGAYTWSRAINMTDDDGWASVLWNWEPAFRRNRALAGYDHAHVFQVGWVYELPFGKGKKWINDGVASQILGGWFVNGVMACYTGTPFMVTAPGASLNAPSNQQTADQVVMDVPNPRQVGSDGFWIDPTAFRAVTQQRFGTAGRNTMRNPGVWNTDLMINRKFMFGERVSADFRAEFYNLPNTSHFGNANNTGAGVASSDVTSSSFMRITSSFGERQIRFGLRLGF